LDGICYPAYNNAIPPQQVGCIGEWISDGFSNEIEVGYPNIAGVILDLSGQVGNGFFCESDISAQGGIYMDNSNTFGESGWMVSICLKDDFIGCLAWTSTYWQEGRIPQTMNLLTEVWKLHHPDWNFWQGQYEVQVAVYKNFCTSWEAQHYTFYVVSSGCRIDENDTFEVSLFPNPASDYLQLTGLEMVKSEMMYRILDMSGRIIARDFLINPNYPISLGGLKNGLYVLQIEAGDRLINKRFTVIN
jgi:hypothetical protein